jgi:hypothetical protein
LDGLLQVLGKYDNAKGLLFGAKRELVDSAPGTEYFQAAKRQTLLILTLKHTP